MIAIETRRKSGKWIRCGDGSKRCAIERLCSGVCDDMRILDDATLRDRENNHDLTLFAESCNFGNQTVPVIANTIDYLIHVWPEVIALRVGENSRFFRREIRIFL